MRGKVELLKQILELRKKIKELETTPSYPHWPYSDAIKWKF